MKKYIPLDDLLAEIERRINSTGDTNQWLCGKLEAYREIHNFISTLEVKDLQEEPVSEELEEAATLYVNDFIDGDIGLNPKILRNDCKISDAANELETVFKAGAEWQRQKDEHLIWQTSTANYEKGIEEGKQQMMKDATDVTVHIDAGNYPYIPQLELYDYDNDVALAKEGDKYKVVLIKEE